MCRRTAKKNNKLLGKSVVDIKIIKMFNFIDMFVTFYNKHHNMLADPSSVIAWKKHIDIDTESNVKVVKRWNSMYIVSQGIKQVIIININLHASSDRLFLETAPKSWI